MDAQLRQTRAPIKAMMLVHDLQLQVLQVLCHATIDACKALTATSPEMCIMHARISSSDTRLLYPGQCHANTLIHRLEDLNGKVCPGLKNCWS